MNVDLSEREKLKLKIGELKLDNENPRFGKLIKGFSEDKVLDKLVEEKNLGELIQSIRENGYYDSEPLLVFKSKDKYVVVEGNRRLAALKILLNKNLAKKYGFESICSSLSQKVRKKLKDGMPALAYKNRGQLWSYLGYRHIKGAMPWDAYSKGLYILDIFEKFHVSLDEIAEKIGDRNSTVHKIFNGMRILKQAEAKKYIDPNSIPNFPFSHFYTILGYKNTQKFLGIDKLEKKSFSSSPIKKSCLSNLKKLIEFLYGDIAGASSSVIKSQNPDLRRLDSVLNNKNAISYLEQNRNESNALEYAFAMTGEKDYLFEGQIFKALDALKKAQGNLHLFKGGDKDSNIFSNTKEIYAVAKEMIERMQQKIDSHKK